MFGLHIDFNTKLTIYILFAISVIGMAIRYHHRQTIKERVEGIGGKLLSCKQQYSVFGAGPYDYTGNFGKVYYYVYSLDGKNKHGWVKFSLFRKPDWRV